MTVIFSRCSRTLPAVLVHQADAFGNKPFLMTEVGSFPFADMPLIAAGYAALLNAHGVSRGDRIAVMSENRLEMLQLFLGCAWAGATFVPLNTGSKGAQLEHILHDAEPKVLVLESSLSQRMDTFQRVPDSIQQFWSIDRIDVSDWPHHAPILPMPQPEGTACPQAVAPEDPLAILYTSGTTGPSKGVICPHAQFTYWGETVGKSFLQLTPSDALYTCLPAFHTNALNAFVQALVCGASFTLGPRFSASRFWERLTTSNATVTYLLGAMVSILMARSATTFDRAHNVSRALAPATPAELWEPFKERFGIRIIEGHGMTETNAVIGPRNGEQRPGFMGRIMEGFHARVVDERGVDVPPETAGELLVSSDEPLAFASGYWRNEDATQSSWLDGWFRTGDRVIVDIDGYFRFLDRTKDAIRRRGENVSAWEVEQVLLLHPSVATAAVIGVPSALGEEDVMACVVARDGEYPDPRELVLFSSARLAYFAVPRYIEYFAELPLTESGKVMKYALRERGVTSSTWDRESAGVIVPR
jgi:crotonobetaine/carnitine-CoA ligase